MTDAMAQVRVDDLRPGVAAPAGRTTDRMTQIPEVPPATTELDFGMDPDFVAFFTALLPHAVAVARRITGDLASAEDAAGEALAKAYLRWPKLRRTAYRDAWVLRVATNEAIGTVRTQRRRDGILRRQPPPVPVTDDRIEAHQLVVDQISRLPRRQRQVVMLRFFADLTIDEVASTLGLSAGAVKSHLHRALHTLRQRLGTNILGGALE
jgi:RNA polymerase sigma-70 factor (sigma-E family)